MSIELVSRMGEIDVTGDRTISEQPMLVFYSSHRTHLLGLRINMKT